VSDLFFTRFFLFFFLAKYLTHTEYFLIVSFKNDHQALSINSIKRLKKKTHLFFLYVHQCAIAKIRLVCVLKKSFNKFCSFFFYSISVCCFFSLAVVLICLVFSDTDNQNVRINRQVIIIIISFIYS
jgi:hypothetical protein